MITFFPSADTSRLLASTSFALSGLWVKPWPVFLCGTNDFGMEQLIDCLIECIEPRRLGPKVNWFVSGCFSASER